MLAGTLALHSLAHPSQIGKGGPGARACESPVAVPAVARAPGPPLRWGVLLVGGKARPTTVLLLPSW